MTKAEPNPDSSLLTHCYAQSQTCMVGVAAEAETHRVARDSTRIRMQLATFELSTSSLAKNGDGIGITLIATTQGVKRRAGFVPPYHPLPVARVAVKSERSPQHRRVNCSAQVETLGRTGAEIEALAAKQLSLLTIYGMSKAAVAW